MASKYTMVAYGSQGGAVKQLQSELNKRGYQLDEDGIYGKKTKAAVRDYQKKSGLTMVDGIAGDETWGSLLSAPTMAEQQVAEQAAAAAAAEAARPEARVTESTARKLAELERGYQPSEDVAAARAYRDSVAAMQPEDYTSGFEARLQELYDQIAGREAFSYDPEEDEMYKRYARLYAAQGAAAMEDTMGQAAALSGGYGSSYAQQTGQQAYSQYLSELSALIPELEKQARSRYEQQGQALMDRYGLLQQAEQVDYSRWQDQLKAWQSDSDRAYEYYNSVGKEDRDH